MRRLGVALAVTAALVGFEARAAPSVSFGVNAGALEVVALPWAHGGFYPYMGGSVAVSLPAVTFIAALSFEWSFDQRRGGFVLVLTADFPVSARVGLDVNLALIQDMPGVDFTRSDLFLGLGPGVSIFVDKWTFSPFVGVFRGVTAVGGWSLVPGVNVAYSF